MKRHKKIGGLRNMIGSLILYFIEPHSRKIIKHLMKDRNLLEQLKARLESFELGDELGQPTPYKDRFALLDAAVAEAQKRPEGLWLEFGVWKAHTLNHIAEKYSGTLYGFDSFEGLPKTWVTGLHSHARAGKFSLDGNLPRAKENVVLIKGWFKDTVPGFLREHPEPAAFVHIDSDLYESANYVLGRLKLADSCVMVFDEFFNYPNWRDGEYKAFKEFLAASGKKSRCIGYSPAIGQAAFVLTS